MSGAVHTFPGFSVEEGKIYTFSFLHNGRELEGSGRLTQYGHGFLYFAEENIHRDFYMIKPENIKKISK